MITSSSDEPIGGMPTAAIPIGTGLLVTAAALIGAAPGLSWLDAGDFVTASSTLGVPHSTGFPLHTALGHLVGYLPIGNLAGRLAVTSSLASGVAAGLTTLIAVRHLGSPASRVMSGLAIALVFITSPTLFTSARVPEVYALHCALAAGCLVSLDRWLETGDFRYSYTLGLLVGLGLTNHALFRMLAPIFAAVVLFRAEHRRPRPIAIWLLIASAATLAYIYLPVAAGRAPVHNWGNPSSLGRFWAHVNAAEIRQAFQAEMQPTVFTVYVHATTFLRQLWSGLGPLLPFGLAAIVACAISAARRSTRTRISVIGVVVGLVVAVELIYAAAINPMGLPDLQVGQLTTLLLGAAGVVLIGRLVESLTRRAKRLAPAAGVCVAAFVPAALLPFADHDYHGIRQDWAAEDLAVIHTSYASDHSVTTLMSDSLIGAHLYASVVLDARPDMVVFGRNQVASGARFAYATTKMPFLPMDREKIAGWKSDTTPVSPAEFRARCDAIVSNNYPARSVYWEPSSSGSDLSDDNLVVTGWPLSRIGSMGQYGAPCDEDDRRLCRPVFDASFAAEARQDAGARGPFYRRWLFDQWGFIARVLFKLGRVDQADQIFAALLEQDPARSYWLTNRAVSQAALGNRRGALSLCEKALEIDPLATTALANCVLYARQLKDSEALHRLENHAARVGR